MTSDDFANKLKHVTEERKTVFENIHNYSNIGLLGITKVVFHLLCFIMFIFACPDGHMTCVISSPK